MSPRLPDVDRSVALCSIAGMVSAFAYLRFFHATPSHIHPTFRYITARDEFYLAFPRVSTASVGEKALERGYVGRKVVNGVTVMESLSFQTIF